MKDNAKPTQPNIAEPKRQRGWDGLDTVTTLGYPPLISIQTAFTLALVSCLLLVAEIKFCNFFANDQGNYSSQTITIYIVTTCLIVLFPMATKSIIITKAGFRYRFLWVNLWVVWSQSSEFSLHHEGYETNSVEQIKPKEVVVFTRRPHKGQIPISLPGMSSSKLKEKMNKYRDRYLDMDIS